MKTRLRPIRSAIRPAGTSKGTACLPILARGHDFVLAVGDDTTDLDAFRALTELVSEGRLTGAVRSLMDRAAGAGELRIDVGPQDVLHMLVALCYGSDAPGWQDNVLRLLNVFVDGLQPHREMVR